MFYNLNGHLINVKNVRNAHIWLATNIRIEFNCGHQDYLTISFNTLDDAREAFDKFSHYAIAMIK